MQEQAPLPYELFVQESEYDSDRDISHRIKFKKGIPLEILIEPLRRRWLLYFSVISVQLKSLINEKIGKRF